MDTSPGIWTRLEFGIPETCDPTQRFDTTPPLGAVAYTQRVHVRLLLQRQRLLRVRSKSVGSARARGCEGSRYPFLTLKERDVETGLDYFLARYYSSTQGRFTSPDPLLESGEPKRPQGWNRYAYVLNNPLKFVDPDGLRWAQQVREDGKTYYQWFGTDEEYDNTLANGWSAVTFDESKPFEYVADRGVGGERNSLYVLNPDGTHGFWQTLEYGRAGSSGDFADQLALTGLFQGALRKVVSLLTHEVEHEAVRNASTAVADEALIGFWAGRGTGRVIIRGIEYTEHAIERMAPRGLGGRGAPVSVVENAIQNGTKTAGSQPGTIVHVFENEFMFLRMFASSRIKLLIE